MPDLEKETELNVDKITGAISRILVDCNKLFTDRIQKSKMDDNVKTGLLFLVPSVLATVVFETIIKKTMTQAGATDLVENAAAIAHELIKTRKEEKNNA